MATATYDWLTSQAGTYNVNLAVWADQYLAPGAPIGFVQIAKNNGLFEMLGGFVLDPANTGNSNFVTGGTIGQGMREVGGVVFDPPSFASFQLRFRVAASALGPYTTSVEIGYVPELAPLNYSAALPPWSRNEVSLGTFTVNVNNVSITSLNVTLTSEQLLTLRSTVMSRAGWSGRLAFSLREPVVSTNDGIPFRNSGTTAIFARVASAPFFSGLIGGPAGGKARFVRDGRFGMPALASQLVQDGDQPGLWVRAEDWDPEDEEATYRPRRGEGTVDDSIPEG